MKKKEFLLILVVTLLPLFSTAQQHASAAAKKEIIKSNGGDFADALADFKKGEARLYCQGGLSPIVDRRKERQFFKKYQTAYHDFGCIRADDSLKLYNFAVFELLDFKYGVKWQKIVRLDAIGFEDWKKKQGQ